MKVWATMKDIKAEIASVPDNWLDRFAAAEPENIRKVASARNGKLLYRVSAVLDAIEQRKYFPGFPADDSVGAGEGLPSSAVPPAEFSAAEGGVQ